MIIPAETADFRRDSRTADHEKQLMTIVVTRVAFLQLKFDNKVVLISGLVIYCCRYFVSRYVIIFRIEIYIVEHDSSVLRGNKPPLPICK